MKATFPMTTTLGAHKYPGQIALQGKAMGLSVTLESAGGWFEKTHLFTVTGEDKVVHRFVDAVQRWAVTNFGSSK